MHSSLFVIGFALTLFQGPTLLWAQQPDVVNAQVSTAAVTHGLAAEIAKLEMSGTPVWVGYSIRTETPYQGGWGSMSTSYLERRQENYQNLADKPKRSAPTDHANLLFRIAGGNVVELRAESPDRRLDASSLRFVWLTGVEPDDSVVFLKRLAQAYKGQELSGSALFLIALHRSNAATPELTDLASPGNDLRLREAAAFWLASGRGSEGLRILQKFAREDQDASFRQKLTFDFTVSKDPSALTELIRMAHGDPSPAVRKQAQFWMAVKGGNDVVGSLQKPAEHDPEVESRKQAVFAISQLPANQATSQLCTLADTSKYPEVREQAVFWLGQSSDPAALDYLTKLLTLPVR